MLMFATANKRIVCFLLNGSSFVQVLSSSNIVSLNVNDFFQLASFLSYKRARYDRFARSDADKWLR